MGFRYIKNGLPFQSDEKSIMVESESDLAKLTEVTPGAIAYTAGYKNMWQLSASGTWVNILED